MAYSPVNLSKVATDDAGRPQPRPAFCACTRGDQHHCTFGPVRYLWSQSVITALTWRNVVGYGSLPNRLRCVNFTFCYRQKAEGDTVRLNVVNIIACGEGAERAVTQRIRSDAESSERWWLSRRSVNNPRSLAGRSEVTAISAGHRKVTTASVSDDLIVTWPQIAH